MKALGIAFSARKEGNCLKCTEYILSKLEQQGFKTKAINAYNCELKPCSHCNYECFAQVIRGKNETCPIQDDTSKIYDAMKETDIIILSIPTYGSKASGLYNAFTERSQGIFKSYEEFQNTILNKIIALIVIGNVPAGGDLAYHTVVSDYKDCKHPPSAILLQAAEHDQISLRGTLTQDKTVRSRLDNLVKLILEEWKNKR